MQITTTEQKKRTPAVLSPRDVRALREQMHAAYGKTDKDGEQARAELDALVLPVLKDKNFPQEDFLVLRLSNKLRQKNLAAQARESDLQREEDLIVRSASYAPSLRVLEIYLSRALPRYRALLTENRETFTDASEVESANAQADKKALPRDVHMREHALKIRAVRACLARLCARRAWAFALGVLRHYKELLGGEIFGAQRQIIRVGFAQDKGAAAWENTNALHAPHTRLKCALDALESEPDDELRALSQAHAETLCARAKQALCRVRSEVYAQLLTGEPADVSVLAEPEIAPALSAAQALTGPQASDAQTFNALYFGDAPEKIYKAFNAGHLSARDYLVLMRACYARAAGDDDFSAYALADALTLFCAKNNVSAPCTQQIVYDVLRTAPEDQPARALALKKIYLLQESSK
jgi:hypothetical protein